VARRTDLFLFDLKMAAGAGHREQIGVEAGLIHDNLRVLCATGAAIELRVPIIPGITDTAANLAGLRELIASLPRKLTIKFLPYHRAAMGKYQRFGRVPPLPELPEPTEEDIANCRLKIGGEQ
jgi:pyruvate formate lyase activating enzyme